MDSTHRKRWSPSLTIRKVKFWATTKCHFTAIRLRTTESTRLFLGFLWSSLWTGSVCRWFCLEQGLRGWESETKKENKLIQEVTFALKVTPLGKRVSTSPEPPGKWREVLPELSYLKTGGRSIHQWRCLSICDLLIHTTASQEDFYHHPSHWRLGRETKTQQAPVVRRQKWSYLKAASNIHSKHG